MAATSFLLLLLIPALWIAFFWRVERRIADDESDPEPVDPSEADLVVAQVAAAHRLRREAAAATDEAEKASLTHLAEEAEADADRLKRDLG